MGGEGQKPTSFSTVTFTNVKVMALPSASPRLLNLNHAHSSKKLVFPVKPLKN